MRRRRARAIAAVAALAAAVSPAASPAAPPSRPEPAIDCAGFPDSARLVCARANDGDATALARVGILYLAGRGVIVNSGEAVRLFKLAAAAGDPTGEVFLGYVYETGHGVAKDMTEATRLYRLAAEQGSAQGMNALAWRLAHGAGTLAEAQRWAERAVAQVPDEGTYHDTLAVVLLRRGQPKPALAEQTRALELSPACASCEDRLGDILAALGRRGEARTHWQRALDLSAGVSADPEWDVGAVRQKLAASQPR